MSMLKIFGYLIAVAVLGTSVAMMIMGEKWQKVESSAYSGDKRPKWFILLSVVILSIYLLGLAGFIAGEKSVSGWLLAVVFPLGWGIKGTLVIFNKKGREKVTSINTDSAWTKIALSRIPAAIIISLLAYYA